MSDDDIQRAVEAAREQGLLEGRVRSLEAEVKELTTSTRFLNRAVWALGGAITIVNFTPAIKAFLGG